MNTLRRVSLLLLLVACGSSRTSTPTPTPSGAAGSAAAPMVSPAATGPLSEDAFKALHELRVEAAPARRGQAIELAGGRAYLSLPPGATGPVPAVVVIHEWWGLNGHIEHWADRLASAGFAALAVDLYGGVVATDRDQAMAAMKAVDDAAAARTIGAALDFLAADPRVRAPRRAVIGWCFGGGWALRTALTRADLDAAVIYYGQLETDPAVLGTIKAEVLGIFGDRDQGIPVAEVEAFAAGMSKVGVRHQIARYDAEHAFANPSGPRYDQADAADAWAKALAFLSRTLTPAPAR